MKTKTKKEKERAAERNSLVVEAQFLNSAGLMQKDRKKFSKRKDRRDIKKKLNSYIIHED